MRDVSKKIKTLRTAQAQSVLKASPATIDLIRQNKIPKGDPLPVAKVAAVQAAKNTSQIIPYCHPLPIDYVGVEFDLKDAAIECLVTVKVIYKTGVEMEALTAASVAALTLYDMMKMLDEDMEIEGVKLLSKKGGKSDFRQNYERPVRAAVLVSSDSVAGGKKDDLSGKVIVERLEECGVEVALYQIIADEPALIEKALIHYSDELKLDLVMSTGGTGLSPRDCVPEVMARVIEKEIPGISEAARSYGQERTPYSMLSRGLAGVRGQTVIINLPGSKGGVADTLDAIMPAVLHAFHVIRGGGHRSAQKPLAGHTK